MFWWLAPGPRTLLRLKRKKRAICTLHSVQECPEVSHVIALRLLVLGLVEVVLERFCGVCYGRSYLEKREAVVLQNTVIHCMYSHIRVFFLYCRIRQIFTLYSVIWG